MGSHLTGKRKFQKNSKKIQKFRKHHHSFFSSQNRSGKAEKERKKKKNRSDGFLWVPTRPGIENSKKIVKKFKNLENTIIPSFQVKIGWERPRKRENKKNKFDGYLPDRE